MQADLNKIIATKEDLEAQKESIQDWVKEQIKQALESKPDPTPKPDPCERGPEIKKVTIFGKSTIEVLFDGKNIKEIEATVTDSKNVIVSGFNGKGGNRSIVQFKPFNNHPRFDLIDELRNETYCVRFKAINCTGESTYSFNGLTGYPVENGCQEIGKITGVYVKNN